MAVMTELKDRLADMWQDPAQQIGELLLSKKLEDVSPVLARIPLVSLVTAAYKTKRAWSDYLLAKKVQQFYTAWEVLSPDERRTVYEKFHKKPRAFTEKLLYILESQEDLAKCKLLGVLTTAHLQDKLKRSDYLDLIETVAHLSLSDLLRLNKLVEQSMIFPVRVVGERYVTLYVGRGLIKTAPRVPAEQRGGPGPFYRLTSIGQVFVAQVQASGIGAKHA